MDAGGWRGGVWLEWKAARHHASRIATRSGQSPRHPWPRQLRSSAHIHSPPGNASLPFSVIKHASQYALLGGMMAST